ncbi:MAG: hypothetical protein R2712_27920 [Vicinamibacterales bacterium]
MGTARRTPAIQRLTSRGLKGSRDYGVAAIGVYNGQGRTAATRTASRTW